MKKSLLLLSLAILTIYACTCVSAVSFNPGPLDEECVEAGIENWDDCITYLESIDSCTPSCEEWQECGDDGCGGECGRCPAAAPYCADGVCEQVCETDCDDKECGDDGCGGECGECPNAAPYCIDGVCEIEDPDDPNPGECVPNCENNECGPDGCGDLCGECSEGQLCVSDGPGHTECKEEQDTHSCDGLCTANAGSCWCDLACFEAGDCCEDVCNFCAEDNEEIEKKCQERAS
tara:strand:+ start:3812 stop:4513 length:702 start_codon:yes stop_codon:yes gene_type:complete